MSLTIAIPCFNEAANVDQLERDLLPLVERLRASQPVELLFVDDGSSDGTAELLEARFGGLEGVRIVRHDRNRGLGAAVRTAFQHASGEIVVTTDSDASYPFELIVRMLELFRPGTDIVTASCYHPLGGVDDVPPYRVLLSKTASLAYRLLVDPTVHTYTCLFRAYRREVADTVPFVADGFLGVTELLVNALYLGYGVAELPCRLRVRRYGTSKARLLSLTRSHLSFQLGLLSQHGLPLGRWGRLVGRQLPGSPWRREVHGSQAAAARGEQS